MHTDIDTPTYRPSTPVYQKGGITLLMSMMLLISITLLSIYSTGFAVMDQRISANEYRAMEVENSSSAGLEYGLIWLGTAGNTVSWSAGVNSACSGNFDEVGTITGPNISSASTYTYTLLIAFCRNTAVNANVIQVASTASASSDTSITTTTRAYSRAESGPVNPGFSAAPLVIGGCLSNVLGNPDVFPAVDGGTAIETREGFSPSGSNCIDTGNLGMDADGAHSGDGEIEYTISDTEDMWDYVFSMTRAEIKALADQEVADGIADSQRKYVWITDTDPFHRSIGSPTNFAVIVFAPEANCPKINGGNKIYGVVYIDSECPAANGFGGSEFYGSVVVDGLVTKLNANTEFHQDNGVNNLKVSTFPKGFAPREIGTWSDF